MALAPGLNGDLASDAVLAAVLGECAEELFDVPPHSVTAIVETTLDVLIGSALLVPSSRWNDDCHRCELRLGDHLLDGRCP